jgi:hypothetical protein
MLCCKHLESFHVLAERQTLDCCQTCPQIFERAGLFQERCNDPKPLCQDHHGFGVFLKLFWLWHFVKHFVVLLVSDVFTC